MREKRGNWSYNKSLRQSEIEIERDDEHYFLTTKCNYLLSLTFILFGVWKTTEQAGAAKHFVTTTSLLSPRVEPLAATFQTRRGV